MASNEEWQETTAKWLAWQIELERKAAKTKS